MIDSTTDITSETRFFKKIRAALLDGAETVRDRNDFPQIFQGPNYRSILDGIQHRNDLDLNNLVTQFQENSVPLHLGVHLVRDLNEAGEWIAGFARATQPEFGVEKHIIQHAHPDTRALQLWKRLADDLVSVHTTFTEDMDIPEKTRDSFIGVTVADWGVAESATLVQLTTPSRPRSTSLVPSIHIGILNRNRLLADLAETYAVLQHDTVKRSFTFISGPSKTADIEAHMVHGAHGPREMHVLLVA